MSSNFDFDYLSELYQTDPKKFEELRAKEIEKLIESTPVDRQKRLRGLQFQIDAKRKIHESSPIGACISISKMMHESFETLRLHLNQLTNTKDPLKYQSFNYEDTKLSHDNSAKVIQLHK